MNFPFTYITTLLHKDSTSFILCVVKIMEQSLKFLSILNKLLLDTGSTPVVGSSKNSIEGYPIKDIAHTSFLLFPPLRFIAFTFENGVKSS